MWTPTGTTITTAAQFQAEAGRPGISVVSQASPEAWTLDATRRYNVDDDQFCRARRAA